MFGSLIAAVTLTQRDSLVANRWQLATGGGIRSQLKTLTRGASHSDHIEMAGRSVNAIIRWSVDADGRVSLGRLVRWPMIREKKDDTHAALSYQFDSVNDPKILIDGESVNARATQFAINGSLSWVEKGSRYEIEKTIFPSTSLPCIVERWQIKNTSRKPIRIETATARVVTQIAAEKLLSGSATVSSQCIPGGVMFLAPGATTQIGIVFSANTDSQPSVYPSIEPEFQARRAFQAELSDSLTLKTPDRAINQLFEFSKLRAAENVLATRGGLMHAPGGFNRYLAALWCNDQNEYVSPFFPFLGDAGGNESARNAYQWYASYINPEYRRLPSSIIAEGRSTWQGAGDRGDAAMTAYGASRWALSTGNPEYAREAWPLIEWCLEYCERKKTSDGAIASDSDELEGRFSSGKTNLATSSLTYDALISAAYLAEELQKPASVVDTYRRRATALRSAIDKVFGARVEGFDTYLYHEGLTSLRSWICIPLVMDLHDRAEGTIKALFSPQLWTKDGLLTAAGSTTYWDRSTLYALRGVFRSGHPDLALEYMKKYSERRLFGDHVPYCQEAYPEQNQSHLSAESGLYCRIVTEGLVGIRPKGLSRLSITPQLPSGWKGFELRNIRAFARTWDCLVARKGSGVEVKILIGGKVCYQATKPAGEQHEIELR